MFCFRKQYQYFLLIHTSTHVLLYLDKSSRVRPPSNEHIVRKAIPPSGPTNRQQVRDDRGRSSTPVTLSTSSGRTGRQEHRQPSSYDPYMRPTIPEPTSIQYDPSSRQEAWHTRPQIRSLNHEEFPQSSAFQPIYQSPVPRDRRRPLELDDDTVLQF